MLACFACEIAEAGFVALLTVLLRLSVGEGVSTSFFGGGVGGTPGLRTAGLRDVDVEAEEAVDRIDAVDAVDMVLFVGIGDSFFVSIGEGVGRFPLTEAFDGVEDTRDRDTLEDVVAVPVVLTLAVDIVDTVETLRERAADVGVESDFAVSKFVEPSLVVDRVDAGRDRLEVGRRLEPPMMVLRTVACDLADVKDAADDRGWELSLVEAEDMTSRLLLEWIFDAWDADGRSFTSARE